ELGSGRGSIAATDDRGRARMGCLGHGLRQRLTALGKLLELEYSDGTIPNDGFGSLHGLREKLTRLWTTVHTFHIVSNSAAIGSVTESSIVSVVIWGFSVHRQVVIDSLLFRLWH